MFEWRDHNPYIITWGEFLVRAHAYSPKSSLEKLSKFFEGECKAKSQYVVVFKHPLPINPAGQWVRKSTAMRDAIAAADETLGLKVRYLIGAPEEMVFGTNDSSILDNLHLFKLCLS